MFIKTNIQEHATLACESIDLAESEIRGVKLLGLTSRNRRRYLPVALETAIPLYEGAKVNINHPKGKPTSPRDYQDRLGIVKDVAFRENDGLYGTLRFNPKHPCAPQLIWEAENAPNSVGMSHNVFVRGRTENNEQSIEAIERVISVDLVADPATTNGLFEQEELTEESIDPAPQHHAAIATVVELRNAYPELATLFEQEITEAITRKVTIDVVAALKALIQAQLPYYAIDNGLIDAIVIADETTRNQIIADRKNLLENVRKTTRPAPPPPPQSAPKPAPPNLTPREWAQTLKS